MSTAYRYLPWDVRMRRAEQTRRLQRQHRKRVRELKFTIFERDNWECCNCGSLDRLVPDHIVPLCRGGDTTLENMQTLCWFCNSSKSTRDKLTPKEILELVQQGKL